MIFLIFLLLFNIHIDNSKAYFYSADDKSDINDKQCFCEVSLIHFSGISWEFPEH